MARSPVSLQPSRSLPASGAAIVATGKHRLGRRGRSLESALVIAAFVLLCALAAGRLSAAPARSEVSSAHVTVRTTAAAVDMVTIPTGSLPARTSPAINWGPIIPLPSCPLTFGPVTSFDLCQFVSEALLSVYQLATETIAVFIGQDEILPIVDPADPSSNFLLGTPPAFTYQNPGVELLYFTVSLPVALALIALIVAWGGISMIVRPHLGFSYHTAMELLPRLLLGTGMAVFGLTRVVSATEPSGWLSALIQFTNALDQAIPNPVVLASFADWPNLVTDPTAAGILYSTFAAGTVILLLGILWQLLVRVAVIDLLIVTAPLAMLCWILPSTQRWTELWTRTFVGMLLVQPIQLLALNVGMDVALSTLFTPVDPTAPGLILQAALQIAILFVVARLPRLMQQTQAFGGTILSLGDLYLAARIATTVGRAGGAALAAAAGG